MTDIDHLGYAPMTVEHSDPTGPVSGTTLFCDVPYRFSRCSDDVPSGIKPGQWFNLEPVDRNSGLGMHAIGNFRADETVRWNSFGSPDLNSRDDHRQLFTQFLNRLHDETATWAHWNAFCVAHYPDAQLEAVRVDCVRLFLKRKTLDSLNDYELDKLKQMTESLAPNVE